MVVICWVEVVVQASPARAPPTQRLLMHCGHGAVEFPVRNVWERSGRFTCATPVVSTNEPLALAPKVLTTQVDRGPFTMGSGGPKRQFGLSTQELGAIPPLPGPL